MSGSSPLYAAIDLGSNSFHLLIVRNVAGAVRAVCRIKRKVRLASGLDSGNRLSQEAMQRGWDCLRLFADQLENIPDANIRIVATATLRFAVNSEDFVKVGEQILRHKINVISGETESRIIYHGVMSTSGIQGRMLVVDIGGASTEMILGNGPEIHVIHSLSMGCVTWQSRFFGDGLITREKYDEAIQAAIAVIAPYAQEYLHYGFDCCLGASGTVQALHEMVVAGGYNERVTLDYLKKLKNETIRQGSIASLCIPGLTPERLAVLPGGLAILSAIYHVLNVREISLAGGALREGIIYSLLGDFSSGNTKVRTVDSVIARYQMDREQAQRIMTVAMSALGDVRDSWGLSDPNAVSLYKAAALLSELGLCIEYRRAPQHAAYIINNIDMPGFNVDQKRLLAALLCNERDAFNTEALRQQSVVSYETACKLARLLRIAFIICVGRTDLVLGQCFRFQAEEPNLLIVTPDRDLKAPHYLVTSLLREEAEIERSLGWELEVQL